MAMISERNIGFPCKRLFIHPVFFMFLALSAFSLIPFSSSDACYTSFSGSNPPEKPPAKIVTCDPCQKLADKINSLNEFFFKQWQKLKNSFEECWKVSVKKLEVFSDMTELEGEVNKLDSQKKIQEKELEKDLRKYEEVKQTFDEHIIAPGNLRSLYNSLSKWVSEDYERLSETSARLKEIRPKYEKLKKEYEELAEQWDRIRVRQNMYGGQIRLTEQRVRKKMEELIRCEKEKCPDLPPREAITMTSSLPQPFYTPPPISLSQYDFSKIYVPDCDICLEAARKLNETSAKGMRLQKEIRILDKERPKLERENAAAEREMNSLWEEVLRLKKESKYEEASKVEVRFREATDRWIKARKKYWANKDALKANKYELDKAYRKVQKLKEELDKCEQDKCEKKKDEKISWLGPAAGGLVVAGGAAYLISDSSGGDGDGGGDALSQEFLCWGVNHGAGSSQVKIRFDFELPGPTTWDMSMDGSGGFHNDSSQTISSSGNYEARATITSYGSYTWRSTLTADGESVTERGNFQVTSANKSCP